MTLKFTLRASALLAITLLSASAAAADAAKCQTVTQSDPGWTDIAATNAIAGTVLAGLGYQQTVQNLSVALGFQGLKTGQVDVFLGNWMPAQQPVISKFTADDSLKVLGANLQHARFTLAVPSYVSDAGVKDFADLEKYADRFHHKIYGIAPGSPANANIKRMLDQQDFQLKGWTLVESSESGMLAEVSRAVAKQDWVVFLGWEPHAMNTRYKLTYLSGGDKYFGPDYGSATVNTVTRNGFAKDCPNLNRLFSQLVFTVPLENTLIADMLENKKSGAEAAREALKSQPQLLATWLNGVTTRQGEPGLPAVQKSLGL